jgi:hypothetical protein
VISTIRNGAIFAVVLFLPLVAHAQGAIGGGGGNLLQSAIQWFMQNLALGVITIALLGCGVAVMVGYRNFMVLGGIAVGAAIIGNAPAIAGAFFQ